MKAKITIGESVQWHGVFNGNGNRVGKEKKVVPERQLVLTPENDEEWREVSQICDDKHDRDVSVVIPLDFAIKAIASMDHGYRYRKE